VKPLSLDDRRHVEAAKGRCELHAFIDANYDSGQVSRECCAHPGVLEAAQVHANVGNWEETMDLANAIRTTLPDERKNRLSKGWIT
jgi:hypothetical protein